MLLRIKQEFKQGKTFLKFSFLKATGQAMNMAVPLVVAKFFSPELFGSYSLAKMIMFFFLTLLIASSQVPFIVLANQERAATGKINKAFSIQCTFLILSFCIFLVIILPLNRHITTFAKINRVDLIYITLAFVGLSLKTFLCNLFMATGQRIVNALVDLVFALVDLVFGSLSLILIFVFYFCDRINLQNVFLINALSVGIVIVIFFKMVDFKMLLPFRLEKKSFREMFDFTKWVFLGATAVYFINWGDNLILRYFVSLEDIGVYNLGYQVFKSVVALIFIISTYFLPFISQHIEESTVMRDYLLYKRPKIFVLGVVTIIVLFVLAPHIFKFIYGQIYQDSVAILRILLVASIMALHTAFYGPILYTLKKYRFTHTILIMQLLLNILLSLILVPRLGPRGAAIATVVAYACKTLSFEIYFRLYLKQQMSL
jgi:O-antigen/teichoic acid export membrane protein